MKEERPDAWICWNPLCGYALESIADKEEYILRSWREAVTKTMMEEPGWHIKPVKLIEFEKYQKLMALVNEQAEEEALLCEADSIVAACVQQELRKLHAAIEALLPEIEK